jgi:hypothetical protein
MELATEDEPKDSKDILLHAAKGVPTRPAFRHDRFSNRDTTLEARSQQLLPAV